MFDELVQADQPVQQEQSVQPEQQSAPQEKNADYNMRMMREKNQQLERQNAEMQNYIRQQQSQQAQPVHKEQEVDEIHIDDDGYVEGKHVKKYINSLKNEIRETKKQVEQFNQRSSQSTAEMRLQARYSDFDKVVSQENIEKLAYLKPSLYNSLKANPDLYEKGETAYELIKSYVASDKYEAIEKKIDDNRSRPRSAATISPQAGETPLASVGDYDRRILTQERKDFLFKQSRSYRQ